MGPDLEIFEIMLHFLSDGIQIRRLSFVVDRKIVCVEMVAAVSEGRADVVD